MTGNLIETLMNLSEKEVKIPENKCIFGESDLYLQMWEKGELEAYKINKKLEIQAAYAGASRIYKKNYEESRKNFLRLKEGADESYKIDFLDLPKLNIPQGYKMDLNQGILKFDENLMSYEPVFPQVVIIEDRYVNIETDMETNKIIFIDRLKKKNLVVEAETLSNVRSITKLRNAGVLVTSENAKDLVVFLSEFLAANIYNIEPKKSISRLGWIKGNFIPFDDNCVFDGESVNKPLYDSICSAGDYLEWVEYTEKLRKNKLLRLQMAASFASPLIELTGALPFVFHLWGGTETGKTVSLLISMSIWGNPAMGKLTRTMNMTQNSMMTTASFLYSIPFAGDELQIIKSRWQGYDNLIMAVTEGVDRGRMDGHVNRELKNWNCNFLFTGEEPCTTTKSGGGTKNRVIEIECTEKILTNGNEVANFARANYGYAGPDFIEHVKEYDIPAEFDIIYKELLKITGSTEKQMISFALLLLADKIASEKIYMQEPLCVQDISYLLRNKNDVDTSERAYAHIIDWISVNQSCFSSETETLMTNKQIYGRVDRKDDNIIFINNTILREELAKQDFSIEAVVAKWKDKGYLLCNSQGKNVHSTRINGIKVSAYKIDLSHFRTDEDTEEEFLLEKQAENDEF